MVVVMRERATAEQLQNVIAKLTEMGFDVHRSTGALRTVLGAVGGTRQFDTALLEVLDGVRRFTGSPSPTSEPGRQENTVITIGDVRIGGDEVIVMAGSAERRAGQANAAAVARPGPGPARRLQAAQQSYSFQGLGEEGLAAAVRGGWLPLISEVMDIQSARADRALRPHPPGRRAQHAELHVLRARLLESARDAEARHPATIEEWLLSAGHPLGRRT